MDEAFWIGHTFSASLSRRIECAIVGRNLLIRVSGIPVMVVERADANDMGRAIFDATAEAPLAARCRESDELEAETLRLMPAVDPKWDRASWMHGARYALWWVIHRRGSEITPSEAANRFVPAASVPEGS